VRKLTFFFVVAFFAGIAAAQMKNVAVVETEIDEQSGASAELTSADVRQVTAALRREAVKNLPRNKYNIMTSETVYAQGSAVLEECADENCVITLGSKIGADYIVRGTVSKLRARFTLSVEIYETEDGNLVGTLLDPLISDNIEDLVKNAAAACAEMYKTFADQQSLAPKKSVTPVRYIITATANPVSGGTVSRNPNQADYAPGTRVNLMANAASGYTFTGWTGDTAVTTNLLTITINSDKALAANFYRAVKIKPKPQPTVRKPKPEPIKDSSIKLSYGGGMFLASDFGGGLVWSNGEQVAMPYMGGGAYLFFDAVYAETFVGYSGGGGKWESSNVSAPYVLPYMSRSYVNVGMFAKYPIRIGGVRCFPLLGIDYETAVSGKLNTGDYEYRFDGVDGRHAAEALNTLWFKAGVGVEADLGQSLYLRAELLYGSRGATRFEDDQAQADPHDAKTGSAGGLTLKAAAGIRL